VYPRSDAVIDFEWRVERVKTELETILQGMEAVVDFKITGEQSADIEVRFGRSVTKDEIAEANKAISHDLEGLLLHSKNITPPSADAAG
jgi:hypothetical protein